MHRILALAIVVALPAYGQTATATGRQVLSDLSTLKVKATGSTTARPLADHLATLPDAKITSTSSGVTKSLADWTALIVASAPLASPAFTGTPTAPTAAADTNTTQLSTTAFVVGQAGTATPGMNGTAAAGSSLRYARQDHVHPTDTSRAPLASPTFTGTVTAPKITTTTAGSLLVAEAWNVPTLLNSWVQGTTPVGYYKDAEGTVHVRGNVHGGTIGSVVFTLPTGYRPQSQGQGFAVPSNNALGVVVVTGGGSVTAATGSATDFNLTADFRAEQ